ncbi:hypothetical protein ABZ646_42420, partial [Streptomyces sp. NPDC007162]|uniref:hypothetical protein n=1 Tax=Streptomyces sp. NPDC007162 TaxID=3156917 RepID=UPI0033FE73C6
MASRLRDLERHCALVARLEQSWQRIPVGGVSTNGCFTVASTGGSSASPPRQFGHGRDARFVVVTCRSPSQRQ